MKRVTTMLLAALLAGPLVLTGCEPKEGGEAADTEQAQGDDAAPDSEAAEEAAGDAAHGAEVFAGTCSSCHGPDAMGIEGLGKNLHANAFVAQKSDAEMLAFLKTGRPASDPLNTTGVDMPPKGGNPALKVKDLADVIAHVRSLK